MSVKKKTHKRWNGFMWQYRTDDVVVYGENPLYPWRDWKNTKELVKARKKWQGR